MFAEDINKKVTLYATSAADKMRLLISWTPYCVVGQIVTMLHTVPKQSLFIAQPIHHSFNVAYEGKDVSQ
jgi:hypothetical protein